MEDTVLRHFSFNFKDIVVDEIALEGLDGIALDYLWRRVEKRISSSVTLKMMIRFWDFILSNEAISVYKLPEPRPRLEIVDRFSLVNPTSGQLIDPPDFLDGPYDYCPVKDDWGSCAQYKIRRGLSKAELKKLSYEEVFNKYQDTLVLVASIEERWKALASHKPETVLTQLTPLQYCMIELVGRARDNGQTTIGKSNLSKIIKEPKLLFYNRKQLQDMDLLKVQSIAQIVGYKAGRSLLIRIKRFHKPCLLTLPREGIIYNIIQNILEQPDQTDTTDAMLKKGIMKTNDWKRIIKSNLFKCDKRSVYVEEKNKTLVRRFVTVNYTSEESSQSEEECEESLPCQYKVKVALLRQAYERILESKERGLSLVELGKILGVEFYTARTIIRMFKSRKIIKGFNEDVGRARVGRFVAVSHINNSKSEYEEEKKKFMEHLTETKSAIETSTSDDVVQSMESDNEVPRKKIKLENLPEASPHNVTADQEALEGVTEIKTLTKLKCPSITDPQKKPTLRQLKYANGILEVLKEKKVVSRIQLLNVLVSKETKEPPMDQKNLKAFLQSLASTGQIKILRVAWPGYESKCTLLFTAPDVQATDSIIRAKYKEIYVRAFKNMKTPPENYKPNTITQKRPLTLFSLQRYTKLRMIHEFLMNLLYFERSESFHTSLPKGFSCYVEILPEFTVRFAVGNISEHTLIKLPKSKTILSMMDKKLADVPSEIFRIFVTYSSLETGCLMNFKLLAFCGLLQLIEDPKEADEFKTPIGHVFYLNRRASIIDTTGEWPRKGVDKEALKKTYYFETKDDVERYWSDVCKISTNTTIELETAQRQRKTIPKYLRPRDRVEENDNGQVLGDGKGPCGFDSSFFMDCPRLWSDSSLKGEKKQTKVVIKKKKPKSKPATVNTSNAIKKKSIANILKPMSKVVEIEQDHPDKDSNAKKTRVQVRTWPKEEDRILMLGKAALTVLSPVAQPGCITLRNIVVKYLLTLMNSKHLVTHIRKRAIQQELDPLITYERDCVINEVKRRTSLMKKYEGVFSQLKRKYSGNLSKAIAAARVVMLELVWTMRQLMQSESFNQKVSCVAPTLEDFHSKFTISHSNVNMGVNSYKTLPTLDPTLATLKEGIIQNLAIYFKRNLPSEMFSVILSIFKPYPELKMRQAIEELRRSGAIAAKEKNISKNVNSLNVSYKISKKHQRLWSCRLNSSEFIDKLTSTLKDLPQTGLNGKPEVNCFLLELSSKGVLELINESVPVLTGLPNNLLNEDQLNVTDMQMNYNLKTGTIGWRLKEKHIKNIPELYEGVNLKEAFDNLLRNSLIKEDGLRAKKDDIIVSHLKTNKEFGSSFSELQTITGYDIGTLKSVLSDLESSKVIHRLGYFENVIVLTEYADPWTLKIYDKKFIPTPWLTHDIDIHSGLLVKWMGAVVNKIFKKPGCSIAYLADVCEFISTRAVQEICTTLEKLKCVTLKSISIPECDLFSDENVIPDVLDFNPYGSVDNILVFPAVDILTRFAYFRMRISNYENEQSMCS